MKSPRVFFWVNHHCLYLSPVFNFCFLNYRFCNRVKNSLEVQVQYEPSSYTINTILCFFTFVLCFRMKQWDSTIHWKAFMVLSPFVAVRLKYLQYFWNKLLYTAQSYFGRLKCTEALFLLWVLLANPWVQLRFTLIIIPSSTVVNWL